MHNQHPLDLKQEWTHFKRARGRDCFHCAKLAMQ